MDKSTRTGACDADAADLALIERVLSGDRVAFETLVRRHERRVFRVTLAVLGNVEDAEEAMQDCSLKLFHHLDQFRKESRFTTWLTRIAINEALQKRRTRKNTVSLEETEEYSNRSGTRRLGPWQEDPEKLYGKQEVRRMVESAIQSLPEIYREALVLRDIEGLSAEEAAEVLGITIPALKSRLLRARLMLRDRLAASWEAPISLPKKMLNKAAQVRDMVAMRLMRVAEK